MNYFEKSRNVYIELYVKKIGYYEHGYNELTGIMNQFERALAIEPIDFIMNFQNHRPLVDQIENRSRDDNMGEILTLIFLTDFIFILVKMYLGAAEVSFTSQPSLITGKLLSFET